jgi:hypothetical protein
MSATPHSGLPFDLDLSLPLASEAEVELTIHSTTGEREALEPSDEIVHIFAMAVNAQMFSDDGSAGTLARVAVLESLFDSAACCWRYAFAVRAVPPRAVAVLVALLAQTRHAGDPITRVTLRARGTAEADVSVDQLTRALMKSVVPRPNLPFSIEWGEGVLESRPLMFTFEFGSPVARQAVESFERALNVWDHLLFFGGFKFDFTWNEDFFPRVGRTAHLTPTLITHALDVFDAPPFALNCVFNWAAAIHNQGYALKSVSLE